MICYKIKNVSCEIEDFIETHLASCVGYFDRAHDVFYVTSSRMLVLIEGQFLTAVELSECINRRLWICMRPYLILMYAWMGAVRVRGSPADRSENQESTSVNATSKAIKWPILLVHSRIKTPYNYNGTPVCAYLHVIVFVYWSPADINVVNKKTSIDKSSQWKKRFLVSSPPPHERLQISIRKPQIFRNASNRYGVWTNIMGILMQIIDWKMKMKKGKNWPSYDRSSVRMIHVFCPFPNKTAKGLQWNSRQHLSAWRCLRFLKPHRYQRRNFKNNIAKSVVTEIINFSFIPSPPQTP